MPAHLVEPPPEFELGDPDAHRIHREWVDARKAWRAEHGLDSIGAWCRDVSLYSERLHGLWTRPTPDSSTLSASSGQIRMSLAASR